MKKIATKSEIEKKETKNKTVLGIILAVIMIFSTAGYAFYQTGKTSGNINRIKYSNYDFVLLDDGFWHFSIGNAEYAVTYNPKDTENISAGNINFNYKGKKLYFSYDSNRQAVDEIARNIERFADRTQFVCVDNCDADLPVKNCSENIIIIKDINETLIKQEENCIYIQASGDEAVKAGDAFIFKLLGITK